MQVQMEKAVWVGKHDLLKHEADLYNAAIRYWFKMCVDILPNSIETQAETGADC